MTTNSKLNHVRVLDNQHLLELNFTGNSDSNIYLIVDTEENESIYLNDYKLEDAERHMLYKHFGKVDRRTRCLAA